jgi:hypothetical protein
VLEVFIGANLAGKMANVSATLQKAALYVKCDFT